MSRRQYEVTRSGSLKLAVMLAALVVGVAPLAAHATLIATGSTQPSAATLNAMTGPTASTATQVFVGLAGVGTLTLNGSASGNTTTGITTFNADSASGSGITAGFLGNGTITVDATAGSATLNSNRSIALGGLSGATGTLNVQNGGLAQTLGANFGVNVGQVGGATGVANVTGAGSTLKSAGRIHVGSFDDSTGTMTISNGGAVQTTGVNATNTELVVGGATNATGSVTVTGAGSTLTVGGIIMGVNETGSSATLLVQNGATVTTNQVAPGIGGSLGIGGGTNATVTVTGAGSTLNVGAITAGILQGKELVIGGFANGSLLVDNSAAVNASGANVIVSGGVFGTQTASPGLLNVSNGATLTANTVTVNANGTLSGNGTTIANVVLNGGTISPGNSIGTLTINGNLVANSGNLILEVDSPAVLDVLAVSGSVFVGEDVLFNLIFNFHPSGNIFEIEDFFTGFSSLAFDPDFSLFGNVSVAGLGSGDSVTVTHGSETRTFAQPAAVPEPATVTLMLLGLAGLLMLRRRKASALV